MGRSNIAGRSVPTRYFRKQGGLVIEANLTVIREVHGSLIDVTGAVRASPHLAQEVPS